MKCKECGKEIPDDAAFCTYCGADQGHHEQVIEAEVTETTASDATKTTVTPSLTQNTTAEAKKLGMKWYKFIIYFQLFSAALVNLAGSYNIISGNVYTIDGYDYSDMMYQIFKGLHLVDNLYGFMLIGLAILCIYVRMQLAGYKTGAPTKFYYLYLVQAGIIVFYLIAITIVAGQYLGTFSDILSLILSLGMIAINKTYFDKRKHLFVN